MAKAICLNALRVEQRRDIPIYVFGIEGRLVSQIASVSYAQRSKQGVLQGYQRDAVKNHIKAIHQYLESPEAILPNALVLALEDGVEFEPLKGLPKSEWGTFGRLTIPLPRTAADPKPAWIVDGQQRATALSKLDPKKAFPVIVVGFKCDAKELQREQFILVNKTRPLPRDLVHEILPDINSPLPQDLEKRRLAARVLQLVRFDENSPFYGRIRGLGSDDEGGANISQAALLNVVQGSIRRKGVLFDHFDGLKKKHDHRAMARVVMTFYEGVKRVWPSAWLGTPKTSRLVHGVGIASLGHLMDRVMREVDVSSTRAAAMVATRLAVLERRCAWTRGRWPILGCSWNELQNTSQDKSRLTEYLLKAYGDASR